MSTDFSIEELYQAKGWQDRYRVLMQWGKQTPSHPEIRTDENRVQGCESPAWLQHTIENQVHHVDIDSDSKIVKGLGTLIAVLINGKTDFGQLIGNDSLVRFVRIGNLSKRVSLVSTVIGF